MSLTRDLATATMLAVVIAGLGACSSGGTASGPGGSGVAQTTPAPAASTPAASIPATSVPATSAPATATPASAAQPPLANSAYTLPAGFTMSIIANVDSARELAMLPSGDLLVGSRGAGLTLVPDADGPGVAGTPVAFATLGESAPEGVAYGNGFVYATTEHTLWRSPYASGDRAARGFTAIASYRQGTTAPNSDGDVHTSASVAVTASNVYVGIGSSCNACTEVDPTRATIQMTAPDGSGMTTRATRIRNAIALAIDASGHLWAGGAGQDALPTAHPYEYFDDVTAHAGTADYGWPDCEEDHIAYTSGAACATTVAPLVELPAYSTLIGAAFYPASQSGAYAFPAAYRGGLFVTAHGSWHVVNGHHVPPRVAFVAMNGSAPATPVNWSDPTAQWSEFVGGWQDNANGDNRAGRPSGIAVGPQGSLFVADDQDGLVYRIRPPAAAPASARRHAGAR